MALQALSVRNELRHAGSLSQNLAVGELDTRAPIQSIIRICSVNRFLRWHERLLIRLLLRSPRVDKVLIVHYGSASPQQCDLTAAQVQQKLLKQQLDRLYHSS